MSALVLKVWRGALTLTLGAIIYLIGYLFIRIIWEDSKYTHLVFAYIFCGSVLMLLIGFNYIFIVKSLNRPRRRRLFISVIIAPLALLFLRVLLLPRGDDFENCGMYTKELEGGQKIFRGKEYRIEFCGLLNYFQSPNNNKDEVRLRVYSKEGELLAVRYFQPRSGPTRIPNTEYGDSYLMYIGEGDDYNTVLVMPPSQWEWIKARMPRIFP